MTNNINYKNLIYGVIIILFIVLIVYLVLLFCGRRLIISSTDNPLYQCSDFQTSGFRPTSFNTGILTEVQSVARQRWSTYWASIQQCIFSIFFHLKFLNGFPKYHFSSNFILASTQFSASPSARSPFQFSKIFL